MKDIKSYVIGFLTCCCMFLIMGHSDNAEKRHAHFVEDIMISDKFWDDDLNGYINFDKYLDNVLNELETRIKNLENAID